MKEEHEKLIEDIISKFKEDPNGKMHKQVFAIFIEDAELRELISSILIKNLKFIDDVDNQLYRINLNGYSFTSFQDIRDKELAKELKEKLEIDLANSNIAANILNKEVAEQNTKIQKRNNITTWVNIVIGILNFSALLWQIMKAAK